MEQGGSWTCDEPIRLHPSGVWSWRKLMKDRSSVNVRWHGIPQSKQVVLITLGSKILHSSAARVLSHLHHISRSLSSLLMLNRGLPSISEHIGSLISICSIRWSRRTARLCMVRVKSQIPLLRKNVFIKGSLKISWKKNIIWFKGTNGKVLKRLDVFPQKAAKVVPQKWMIKDP